MKELRQQFNEIDQEIIGLINQRCKLSAEIGQYKKNNNMPVADQERENEIVQSLQEMGKKKGLNDSFVKKLYQVILEESKMIQKKIIEPADK